MGENSTSSPPAASPFLHNTRSLRLPTWGTTLRLPLPSRSLEHLQTAQSSIDTSTMRHTQTRSRRQLALFLSSLAHPKGQLKQASSLAYSRDQHYSYNSAERCASLRQAPVVAEYQSCGRLEGLKATENQGIPPPSSTSY